MSKIGFLFSGQGSQYVGMGKELYDNYEIIKNTYDTANEILGYSISDVSFNGDMEELCKSKNTQAGIFTLSVSILKLLNEMGINCNECAGFSLGEFASLVCAEVLSFEDGLMLVKKRGEIIEHNLKNINGTMAAVIGLSHEQVINECNNLSEFGVIEPVNFNFSGQVVVSGETDAILKSEEHFKKIGGRVRKLNVAGPFHSSLLDNASTEFGMEVNKIKFNDPVIPIYSNTNGEKYKNAEDIKELIVKQLKSPVYWDKTIINMVGDGVNTFIELGPKNTLISFLKKIDKSALGYNVENMESLNKLMQLRIMS